MSVGWIFGSLGILSLASSLAVAPPQRTTEPKIKPAPVVRVNSTNQAYDYARPWAKKPPFLRRGTGAILADGRVLVTAELVANHSYVELEKPLGAEKSPARVVAVDYDANLALVEPVTEGFLAGLGTFPLATRAAIGQSVEVLQLEPSGELARTPATITGIAVIPYPFDSATLLSFRLSSALQSRDSSFVLPTVSKGELLGLIMRYDSRSQTADIVPFPIIRNFLERARAERLAGLPRAGFSFASLRDPALRQFLALEKPGGIYLTDVLPESPAAEAGLQRGDVILEIGGHRLDADGLYDDPAFGKLLFTHLLNMRLPGDAPLEVLVFREGKTFTTKLKPQERAPSQIVSEPYHFDRPPRYLVLGGIIFQELSGAFLREWGNNWRKNAPQRLVFLDTYQTELPPGRGKIVFVSGILPSDDTLGYGGITNLVVTRVNGQEIRSLEDLAQAVKSPEGRFHKIEFEEDPRAIYLDAAAIERNAGALARDYAIPSPDNLQSP